MKPAVIVIEFNSANMPEIFPEIVDRLIDWREQSKFKDDILKIHLGTDSQATGILAYTKMQIEKNVC